MATWQCIQQCGACCYLDPTERPDLDKYLTEEELGLYLNMVDEDGWCVNFDHETRKCTIYADRPRFCRVAVETFHDMFGIEPEELNDFAIDCCHQHIESIYGDRSGEKMRFNEAVGC
ncbi:MAG: YkgJ family cysteine cluster protein [Sphaerospermopsis sp. SIO1G2]|nr:YkgJ family cysteine cluster protein [Sphaerospermopsis sp. SIO1G1]NET73421.1 YkgJ family cysteine cluster protein [Sphaerospermopsis sp. SIO1G2]